MAMRTDDKRIASMLQRARELAARGHQPLMIEAVLAANGSRLARRQSDHREFFGPYEVELCNAGRLAPCPDGRLAPCPAALRQYLHEDAINSHPPAEVDMSAFKSASFSQPQLSEVYPPPLRDMYLELLKKTLINQIYEDRAASPWTGPIYDSKLRELGMDWPSQAMTMIGERRMDNIRQCAETILADNIPGDFIETGIWRGGACIFMRGILKARGIIDRIVWAADSFEGLPRPNPAIAADAGDQHHLSNQILGVSLETVQDNFRKFDLLDEHVRFLKGWFKDTLHAAPIARLAILRLDGDMYESTMDSLKALYHKVSPGGFVIVDDYGSTPNCRAAISEFRKERGIRAEMHKIDECGIYWRVM
jgi:O-methyltransferase